MKRMAVNAEPPTLIEQPLLDDLRHLIDETRSVVAATVNAAMTTLYRQIENRISDEALRGERADYGE